MRWLELSVQHAALTPKIEFSFKKPFFAASVVLDFSTEIGSLTATADARARVPIKGDLHYAVEVTSNNDPSIEKAKRTKGGVDLFAFKRITEKDVAGGHGREIISGETSYSIRSSSGEKVIQVVNESPTRLLAHLQTLPAFQQTYTTGELLYGGYIAIGTLIEALRIERTGPAADALAQSKSQVFDETYEVRTMRVPRMFGEKEWAALPWDTRKAYGFTYDVAKKTLTAASFSVPIIGKIEIKA